jgi:hypothetical protein
MDRWLAHELKPLVDDCLDERRLREVGILDPATVAAVRGTHAKRVRKDTVQRLWNLVVFEQWRREWKFSA